MLYYGDELYGLEHKTLNIRDIIQRQALHAYKVSFNHPITNEYIEFISKLPEDMNFFFKNI
ncbi:MAG: RluA family pseudouridine synthase [Clostridia bacterium]|jgi:23S rRNA pseudouridine1911/1915/1917 synthase|nr:RluA family pseudouridine synthase [Clostridia bacterium]